MRATLPIVVIVTVAALATANARLAQQPACELEVVQTPGQRTQYTTLPDGGTRVDLGGGVEATCGTKWLRADSASYFKEQGLLLLIGNVEYTDAGRRLVAERATYFETEGWVRCEGSVRLTDEGGRSTLSGPSLDYFPASDTNAVERIFAPGRPHLTFYANPAGGPDSPPFDVDADRMHIYGDSAVAAGGRVVAIRGELTANSDSMDLDLGSDRLWLLGDPNVRAADMLLKGDSILVLLEDGQVKEIQSWPNGSARGRDMELAAPFLRFFVANDEVERAVASGGEPASSGAVDASQRTPWAESKSQEYSVTADSIEIRRPGGRLDRVIAIGRARATTRNPVDPDDPILGYDWLAGDTITGHFVATDPVAADGREAELRSLVASGGARALYHIIEAGQGPGGETEAAEATNHPAVNYVLGRVITLWLGGGEVDSALVVGPATGLYNEPLPGRPAGDTASVKDSIPRVESDTLRAADDTTRTVRGGTGSA